jgi:parallel beta-helix repeat protein
MNSPRFLTALALTTVMGCTNETPPELPGDCTALITPSADDTATIQEALLDADAGAVICLDVGTYSLEAELSLTVREVTVKGLGESREDVVLDFAGQTRGDDGFTITADDFTIENMWIKNTPGNGVVATGVDRSVFRNLEVSWDAGSSTDNGAYAIYPVGGIGTLVENNEIVGASDAGIYVGQTHGAIVRGNEVHGNVAGIEIENSDDAQVYDNHTYDNAAGILVFVLPNLEKKDGLRTLVRDNLVEDNNHENFGERGSVIASVPSGTGILLLGCDDTEIRQNTITGNVSTGVLAVSYQIFMVLVGDTDDDPDTDKFLERTYIFDNTFDNNGTDPQGALSLLEITPVENIVWDGIVPATATEPELCLGAMPDVSFRNIGGLMGIGDTSLHTTDTAPHACEFEPLTFEPLGIVGE